MTKISTKGRYALRIMIDLARHAMSGPTSLRGVADREFLAIKYLESIASLLLRRGLISSTRGKDGGYTLAKPASEYTVYEIVSTAEGNISPVHCLADAANNCPMHAKCPTLPIWEGLEKVVREYLHGIRLSDLVNDMTEAEV